MHLSTAQPHTTEQQQAAAVVRALRRPRYEVLPVDGVEDEIAAVVPRDLPITVTASPRRGLEPTIALTELLRRLGHVAVPHLAARQIVDESHLGEILGRLDSAGVRDAFVVAGDCPEPCGRFADSLALLTAMSRRNHGLERIGIAGYPDGHPFLPGASLARSLADKARFSTYVVSQLCFDPAAVAAWVHRLRTAGVTLPVYVGISGVVDRRRLLRISSKIGVGTSARFLRKHGRPLLQLLLPRGYRPDRLVGELANELALGRRLDGLHIYTFNNLRATELWRLRTLDRLESAVLGAPWRDSRRYRER